MKKGVKTALIIIGILLFLGVIGFITWGLTPLGPTSEALAAMESNANVTVQDNGNFIVFTPTSTTPITGFIFYPGGHVDCRSYAPVAQEIARLGYMVSIVRMPLSLAVFGINKADEVITAYPKMRYWVIGGHSLGGSMAASYTRKNTDKYRVWCFGHPIRGTAMTCPPPA